MKYAVAYGGEFNFTVRSTISYASISRRAATFHTIYQRISMGENKLIDLSMEFSIAIVKLCDNIKGHRSLIDQVERASTSIGANIHEANYASSKADFIAKLQISLKECYETEYWLELISKTGIVDPLTVKPLIDKCGTIRRLLISSINTAKSNK